MSDMLPLAVPLSWSVRQRLQFLAGLLFGLCMGLLLCEMRHWLEE